MSKQIYEVRGTYTITILKRVKANSEDEAMELADRYFNGINEYCGNGGWDKLVGVECESESVQADGCVDWFEAYETDDDRYDEETDNESCTYVCNLCGETFKCENDEVFDEYIIHDLWEHMKIEHSYEDIDDLSDLELVEEYFEKEIY